MTEGNSVNMARACLSLRVAWPSAQNEIFTLEEHVAPLLASGTLVRVLEDWCPPFAGYFLYYHSRRQQRAALSALIDTSRH